MCRLFAVLAERPVKVSAAFRALAEQSKEHKDGWGVVRLDAGAPEAVRGLEPAGQSARFSELGQSLESRALFAHIRLASVGPVTLENNHPFLKDGWAFMHNGTVKNFARHQAALEAALPERLKTGLAGQTESERCFALFLSLLESNALDAAMRALARAVRTVTERCDADAEAPASLNFLASDGRRLIATRHGRSLWLHSAAGVRVIASERLWPEGEWTELADGDLVAIDADLSVRRHRIEDLA